MWKIYIVILISLSGCQAADSTSPQAVTAVQSQPSAFAATPTPTATPVPVTPTGKFVYVGSGSDALVTVMAIESDGSLSFVQQLGPWGGPASGYGISFLSFDTGHNNLYIDLGNGHAIEQYSIDPSTGMLTASVLNQSIFTAQSSGATFTTDFTSAVNGSVTFSISSGYAYSSAKPDSYQAGINPITMLIK